MSLTYTDETTAYNTGTIRLSFLPSSDVLIATGDDNPSLYGNHQNNAQAAPASGISPGPSGKLYAVTAATNLRSAPSMAASVTTTVPAGTMVGVQCKAPGEAVNGPWGSDSYWDRVVVNGATGYLTDEYVNTQSDETNNALIPNC
jgi:uncharacterized protein YgiM (DUF1202 family)